MEYMKHIARNIKICIWDLGFGPLAWALGTLGPKSCVWAPCMGPWDPWPFKQKYEYMKKGWTLGNVAFS